MSALNRPTRPEPYPGNPETWKGEWLSHPMVWIKECLHRAHLTATRKEQTYSMSIPAQRWDPDIVLYDAVEELEKLRGQRIYDKSIIDTYEAEVERLNAREEELVAAAKAVFEATDRHNQTYLNLDLKQAIKRLWTLMPDPVSQG